MYIKVNWEGGITFYTALKGFSLYLYSTLRIR